MQWGKVIGCYQTASRAEDFGVLAAIMAPHAVTLAGDNCSSIAHVQRVLLGGLGKREHVSVNNDVREAIRTHIEVRGAGTTLALKFKAHATEEQLREGRITRAQLLTGKPRWMLRQSLPCWSTTSDWPAWARSWPSVVGCTSVS